MRNVSITKEQCKIDQSNTKHFESEINTFGKAHGNIGIVRWDSASTK